MAETLEQVEDRIYISQARWILKRFGAKAADSANYGWGVDETDNWVNVQTKVYGHGVLRSEATIGSKVEHMWEEFGEVDE